MDLRKRMDRGRRADENNAASQSLIIEPTRGWLRLGFAEVWRSRELLYFLTWRDVKVRYKQAVLGIFWALIGPFMRMVVLSLVFGRLAGLDSEGYPYPIFLFAGLLPWQFFSAVASRSGQSVVGGASLVTKVYFPRLILPIASAGAMLFDLAISFGILIGLMLYYHMVPGVSMLLVVPLVFLTLGCGLGVGIFCSALNVAYRDFRQVLGFLLQMWMYLTPVVYSVTIIPDRFRWLIMLNPMAGIVDGFRAVILGRALEWGQLGVSLVLVVLILFVGVAFFRRIERWFADIV